MSTKIVKCNVRLPDTNTNIYCKHNVWLQVHRLVNIMGYKQTNLLTKSTVASIHICENNVRIQVHRFIVNIITDSSTQIDKNNARLQVHKNFNIMYSYKYTKDL